MWDKFIPDNDDLHETKAVFYAGAHAVISILIDNPDLLDDLRKEYNAFYEEFL